MNNYYRFTFLVSDITRDMFDYKPDDSPQDEFMSFFNASRIPLGYLGVITKCGEVMVYSGTDDCVGVLQSLIDIVSGANDVLYTVLENDPPVNRVDSISAFVYYDIFMLNVGDSTAYDVNGSYVWDILDILLIMAERELVTISNLCHIYI